MWCNFSLSVCEEFMINLILRLLLIIGTLLFLGLSCRSEVTLASLLVEDGCIYESVC